MSITNTSKPSTSISNTIKVSNSELWSTITNTWSGETRTWLECISTMTDTTKPSVSTEATVDEYTDFQDVDTLGYGYRGFGQSFTGNGGILSSVHLLMSKTSSPPAFPTGTVSVKIYAETHATAFGTDSLPTGAVLATSNEINVAELGTSLSYIPFVFTDSNKITLANGTKYVLTIEYAGTPTTADTIAFGFRYTTPTHSGNRCYRFVSPPTWVASATSDYCFKVKSVATSSQIITNTSKP